MKEVSDVGHHTEEEAEEEEEVLLFLLSLGSFRKEI